MKHRTEIFDHQELSKRCRDLRGLVRTLVQDTDRAADLEQRVWLKALQNQGNRIHSWRSWCRTVALNLIRGDARRRSRNPLQSLSEDVESGVRTPDEVACQLQIHRRLGEALQTLKEPCKSVIVLRFLSEMEPQEIAKQIGIPASTVRSRIFRGLALLRAEMDEEFSGSRTAWTVPLAGLIGLPPLSTSFWSKVHVFNSTKNFLNGAFLVKKTVAFVIALSMCVGIWIQIDFRDSSLSFATEPTAELVQPGSPRRHESLSNEHGSDENLAGPVVSQAKTGPIDPRENSIRIQGKILREDRTPIPNTILLLRPMLDEMQAAASIDPPEDLETGGNNFRTTSSSEGLFTFEVEDVGTFECFAYAIGFRPQRQMIVVQPEAPRSLEIELVLESAESETCIVLDDKGNALANVPVRIRLSTNQVWEQIPHYVELCVTSDSQGTFQVVKFPPLARKENLSPPVVIHLEHPAYAQLSFKGTQNLPRDSRGRVILRLERGRQVEFQFEDRAGMAPLSHLQFRLNSLYGTWSSTAQTDETGHATLTQVPSTNLIELMILSKDWALVGSGGKARTLTRILRLSADHDEELSVPVARLKTTIGHVVEAISGRPVKGVEVRAIPSGVYDRDLLRVHTQNLTTDESGAFVLDVLSSGEVLISIRSTKWQIANETTASAGRSGLKFNLQGKTTSEIEVAVSRSASIKGMVRDTKGTRIDGAKVSLVWPKKQQGIMRTLKLPVASTDDEGRYSLEGLPTGQRLYFVVRHPAYARSQQTRVLTPGESNDHVDFVVSTGATLKVKIVDVDEHPVRNVLVEVAHRRESDEIDKVVSSSLSRASKTDADGVVAFRRLPAGPTIVSFQDPNSTAKRFMSGVRRIELADGDRVIVVRVGTTSLVRGLARRSDGQPIPNARLRFRAIGRNGKGHERIIQTDSSGRFSFAARLPSEPLPQSANAPGGTSMFSMKRGRIAKKGEVGWSYELVGATIWEHKNPSRADLRDSVTLSVIRSPQVHPRPAFWEFVFAN